jgi:phage head maturation protease
VSGLEYGPPIGGFAVNGRAVTQARKASTSNKPSNQVLEGFACLYDVPHHYKGRTEIFSKGCFAGSLTGVMFLTDHVLTNKKLGDQDDGNLELFDTDVGLAFRLKLAPGDLERLDGRDQMSPCYQEHQVELRKVGGETIRVITSASLVEVSACHRGAMRTTFAEVRDANAVGTLANDAKNFASDGAAIGFLRALRKLQ